MALRVTSERVRDVRFAEQWRGYRTQEVDEFVEQVADALDGLEGRLEEAMERTALAERRLSEQGPDETLQRTLVLAQRTADAALEEAKIEAARMVADAEERARSVLAHLEERRADIEGEIEARMSTELAEVSERRVALESDLELLGSYVERSRDRLVQDLRAQLQWLERGEPLESLPAARPPLEPPPPEPPPLEPPPPEPPPPGSPSGATPVPTDVVPEDRASGPHRGVPAVGSSGDARQLDAGAGGPQASATTVDGGRGPASGSDAPTDIAPTDIAAADRPAADDTVLDDTVLDDLDVIPWDDVADEDDDAGVDDPLVSGEGQADDDPFIAELRRAVDDPEPLGPREESVEWSEDVDLFDRSKGASKRSRRRPR